MKQKVTIDKLIASSQENAAPPPPDPDLMWADMAKRLDAATPPASVSDSNTPAGPGPAPAATKATTLITWLIAALAGAGALYAIASRQQPQGRENLSMEVPASPSLATESALLTAVATDPFGQVDEPEGGNMELPGQTNPAIQAASHAGALERNAAPHTRRQDGVARGLTAPRSAGISGRTNATAPFAGQEPVQASAMSGTNEMAEAQRALFAHAGMPAPEVIRPSDAIAAGQGAWLTEVALLPGYLPFLEAPAPTPAFPPVAAPASPSPRAVQGLILYAGSSLGKTPRVYQNYTPAPTYLNLGIGYRMPLSRRWSLQPEMWWLQFETPRLSVVTEQRSDLDGSRILRYDTVSVMRMQGIGINLTAGAELPAGFTLFGGAHLGRYAGVMTETAFGSHSLVGVNNSWGSGFNYGYDTSPDWFQVYQAGIKLGVEKRFRQRLVLGLSVYQGLSDLYRTRESGPANLPNSWVIYAGYRL